MHTPVDHPEPINAARLASLERKSHQSAAHGGQAARDSPLNEGQACAFLGVGRRKFQYLRQEPWFVEKCTAIVLGPRALRWLPDELVAAMKNAPRALKLGEPEGLAAARVKGSSSGRRPGRHTETGAGSTIGGGQ